MPDYFIFGGCLRSELEFPELAAAHDQTPTWTLHLGDLPPFDGAEVLSDMHPTATCRTQLARRGDTYRYSHSCSGEFEIAADGRTIVFAPASGGSLDIARTDLVARVLLHCVDRGDVSWLHGSAVAVDGTAIAFLAPSGAGKSTLALALARAGAHHVCDDTLPVETSGAPAVWPSDHTLRLRTDSRERLAPAEPAVRRQSDGKFVLTHEALGTGARASRAGRLPLGALYLLTPVIGATCDDEGAAVSRRRIPPTQAVALLMQHIRLGLVVRAGAPALTMQRLAALARTVPVYELRVTRDWSRLGDVASTLIAWHEGERSPAGATRLALHAT